jgi:hypothetical protein
MLAARRASAAGTAGPTPPPGSSAAALAAAAAAAALPVKTTKEALQELDRVLGKDDKNVSNYLARDQMVPSSANNSFPVANVSNSSNKIVTGNVPSNPLHQLHKQAQSQPHLDAADSYLRSQYPPTAWDPRLRYDSARRNGTLSSPYAAAAVPGLTPATVIQAPSDGELMQQQYDANFQRRGGVGYSPGVGNSYGSHGIDAPSAPPMGLDFSIQFEGTAAGSNVAYSPMQYTPNTPHSASVTRTPASRLYHHGGNISNQNNDIGPAKSDAQRLVQHANSQPLRRPIEGGSLEYVRNGQIGVLETATGHMKYFPSMQQQTFSASEFQAPESQHSRENKISVASTSGKRFHVPSSAQLTTHEREMYLNQMRALRQNLVSI